MISPLESFIPTKLLGYNFIRPIEYDGVNAWGTFKDDSGNYDIHTTVPFYESEIELSWINYSAYSGGTANVFSAWGQIMKSRIAEESGEGTNKRYLSVDWKYDSGVFNNTGDPTIGLAHEANKMIGDDNASECAILPMKELFLYKDKKQKELFT